MNTQPRLVLSCLVLSYILQTPRRDIAQKGVSRGRGGGGGGGGGGGVDDRVDWSDTAWSRDSGKVTASSGKLFHWGTVQGKKDWW